MTQMQFCPCGRYFTLCRFFFFFLPRMTAAENTAWHKVNKQIIHLFTVLCQAGLFCHKCTHNWTSAWSLYFVFPRPVFVSLTEFCPEVWKFALWCKDKLLGFFLFLSFSCSAHGGCKILMLCSVTAVLSPVGLEWKKKYRPYLNLCNNMPSCYLNNCGLRRKPGINSGDVSGKSPENVFAVLNT